MKSKIGVILVFFSICLTLNEGTYRGADIRLKIGK